MTDTSDRAQDAPGNKKVSSGSIDTPTMKSFTEATQAFLEAATWLTDADLPMVTALQQAASELDTNGVQAALLNTYGVTYRTLVKSASQSGVTVDEHDLFLNGE